MLLFGEKGYEKTTIDGISKHAELSKGIIFHYFTNKDTLFVHCIRNLATYLVQYLEEHESQQGDLKEQLNIGFHLRPMF